MKNGINNAALNKALKAGKESLRVCRSTLDGADYLFYTTGYFLLAVPSLLFDALSNYARALALTPEGERLKPGECVSYGEDTPRMVPNFDPSPLLRIKSCKTIAKTRYITKFLDRTCAVYMMDGRPVILPENHINVLHDTETGETEGALKPVLFENMPGIKLLVCPCKVEKGRHDELQALVDAIVNNKIIKGD